MGMAGLVSPAVLSIIYSDGWDAREVSELWGALGKFHGLGAPMADELPPPSTDSGYVDRLSARVREALHRTK